jgi:hypothetical protein
MPAAGGAAAAAAAGAGGMGICCCIAAGCRAGGWACLAFLACCWMPLEFGGRGVAVLPGAEATCAAEVLKQLAVTIARKAQERDDERNYEFALH